MKLFWKWTAAALAAGICACNFAFPSVSAKTEDSSSNVYLCDEGDFLSDSEFQTAMEELQNAADESGMNVALWIGNTEIGDGSDEDTVAFCDDTYEELYGIDTDGVLSADDLRRRCEGRSGNHWTRYGRYAGEHLRPYPAVLSC